MYSRSIRVWHKQFGSVSIYADVYRSAHDNRTYVARIESIPLRYGAYQIKFNFRTKKAAIEWVEKQKRPALKKIREQMKIYA